MHRSARLATAAILVLAAAPAVDASATRAVKRGSHGATVRKLQRALGLPADGVFGAGTKRALRRFQRGHGLAADGVAGPATWRALGGSGARGAAGGGGGGRRKMAVRLLQRRLGIGVDGVFGPGTQSAVKAFQRGHGLAADGVVGPGTWSAIGFTGAPVIKRGGAGGRPGIPGNVLNAISAANRIARLPYRWGGGHGSFSDTAYDCSGSVSYVLHAAGQLSRPRDSSELMSYGAAGPGRYITIYSNPGHAFMIIRGRRFDTTGRAATGSRWQAVNRATSSYAVRHPPGL